MRKNKSFYRASFHNRPIVSIDDYDGTVHRGLFRKYQSRPIAMDGPDATVVVRLTNALNRARWIFIRRSRCFPRGLIWIVITPPIKHVRLDLIRWSGVHPIDAYRSISGSIRRTVGSLTRRDREVVDFTRSRVKNNIELTNLGN